MANKLPTVRVALGAALLLLTLLPAAAIAGKGKSADPGCSMSSGQVVLDQSWTVSAWGLPRSTVNLIVRFPDGTTVTGPITAASDGTFTTTQSSADAIPAEQTGTYTYEFVGSVKWPAGTFNQLYATCSMKVS
jgi:hypothetical protein